MWEKENLRFFFINEKNRVLKAALKTSLTMMSLQLKIVFLHFIIQTDPSDGVCNMALEQDRVRLHHAHSWLHPKSSDSPFSYIDDTATNV